jgi:hypothetical protein
MFRVLSGIQAGPKLIDQIPERTKVCAKIAFIMTHKSVPSKFGLVAGLGMGAGISYYRSLVKAHLIRGLSPNILMVHADVRRVMAHAAARENRELAAYLTGLLEQLSRDGRRSGPSQHSHRRFVHKSLRK